MKKLIVGAGTVGAAAVSMLLFGTGVAAADDYAGQTYADASSAASDAGETVIIASRTGSQLGDDDCIVERSQPAPFVSGDDFARVEDTVQFYLNCNGGYATATTAGASLGSQAGREAKEAADQAAEEAAASEEQALEDVSKPDE